MLTCLFACLSFAVPQDPPDLRAPAVPLVVHDPYFSIWLPHDVPTAGWPVLDRPRMADPGRPHQRRRRLAQLAAELGER